MLAHVFGHGGDEALLRTLRAEGKTPGDPADLWTMCRLLKIVGKTIFGEQLKKVPRNRRRKMRLARENETVESLGENLPKGIALRGPTGGRTT